MSHWLIIAYKVVLWLLVGATVVAWAMTISSKPSSLNSHESEADQLRRHRSYAKKMGIASWLFLPLVGGYIWMDNFPWSYMIGPLGLWVIVLLLRGPLNGLRNPIAHSLIAQMLLLLWVLGTVISTTVLLIQ